MLASREIVLAAVAKRLAAEGCGRTAQMCWLQCKRKHVLFLGSPGWLHESIGIYSTLGMQGQFYDSPTALLHGFTVASNDFEP